MLRLHVKIENPIVKDWLASLSGEKQAPIVFSTEPYERTVQPVAPSFAANTKKTKSGRVSAARPPVESLALTIPVKTPKKRESLTPKSPELPESAVPPPGMQAVTQVGSFRIDGNRIPVSILRITLHNRCVHVRPCLLLHHPRPGSRSLEMLIARAEPGIVRG